MCVRGVRVVLDPRVVDLVPGGQCLCIDGQLVHLAVHHAGRDLACAYDGLCAGFGSHSAPFLDRHIWVPLAVRVANALGARQPTWPARDDAVVLQLRKARPWGPLDLGEHLVVWHHLGVGTHEDAVGPKRSGAQREHVLAGLEVSLRD